MSQLQEVVNRIIRENPEKVQQARQNPALSGWFFAKVVKAYSKASTLEIWSALNKRGIAARMSDYSLPRYWGA